MPIYWALGYHLCRWGYGDDNSTWEMVRHIRNYGIPQVKALFWPSVQPGGSVKLKNVRSLTGRPVERH